MGEVYRAVQVDLQREVALKVLSKDASAAKATERFLREAKVQAKLEHPHLVRLYDAGRAGERLFFAMELVEGKTLSKLLNTEGRPHPSFIARVGGQVAQAFDYFHDQDLVHRDIKPSNIMVTGDGKERQVKIMDFGIAFEKGGERLTRTRAVVGTARYLSPEMARGQEATPKSDVYQLGLVLFELLCGKPPHDGQAAVAIARRAGGERAPDPRKRWPACPARLARLVNATLEPNPEDRPTAAEVAEECEALELRLQGWQAPEGPLEPWSGQEEAVDPILRPSGPTSAQHPAALGSGKFSEQYPEVDGSSLGKRVVLGLAVVILLFLGVRHLTTPVEYRANDVVVTPGARGVVISWTSEHSYPTRIRYGEEEVAPVAWAEAAAKDDGLRHRLVLEGLQPARKYRFHVVMPDGSTSLDYPIAAPEAFRIQRVQFRVVGEDALEWSFQTPVPARAEVVVTTSDGEKLTTREAEAAEEHVVRFTYGQMLLPPRNVEVRFEAADGELDTPFPTDRALGLLSHLAELFSDAEVGWGSFFNEAEDFREELAQGKGRQDDAQLRLKVQEMVKKRFGVSGVLENWAAVSLAVQSYLSQPGPWEERRELIDSLLQLSVLDRLYDLLSLPPFFRVSNLLIQNVRELPKEPDRGPNSEVVREVFPYDGNLLVPLNYTSKSRGRINSFSMTVFPSKGAVQDSLEGSFELPAGGRERNVYLGMEVRGLYPFQALFVDVACPGEDMDRAFTVPFMSQEELTDAKLYNEFDFLKAGGGQSLDTIFPVKRMWVQVPSRALCDGTNKLRLRLVSIQHLSFFPIVARRLFLHVR
jgi:hypothetical protein